MINRNVKQAIKKATTVPLPETSPAAELLEEIGFSTDNVVGAAAVQPGLYVRAINFRYLAMRRRSAAKMAMEQMEAEVAQTLRREALADDRKITEAIIREGVVLDPDVAEKTRAFSDADEMDEYAKLVVEAFRMRRDCLRIVGDLTRDEMSLARAAEAGAEKLSATRQRLKERFPGGEE